MDFHLRLTIAGSRENLAAAGGDCGVTLDLPSRDRPQRFNGQRERSHIEEQNILYLAAEHACLNCRTDGNDLIRIHAFMRLLAEEGTHSILHGGHTSHPTHHHYFVDI